MHKVPVKVKRLFHLTASIIHLAKMGAKRGVYNWDAFDWAVFVYLVLHVPTTLLIDAQSIAPPDLHPKILKQALEW